MTDLNWSNVEECDYCHQSNFSHYMTSKKSQWFEEKNLTLTQCDNCGLAVASPRPDRNIIYDDFLNGLDEAEAAVVRKISRPNVMVVHDRAIKHALKFQPDAKRLFDMGCGAGTIMEAAKENGLTAAGNDINKSAIKRLDELGFETYHGFTNELDLPKKKYDIVINFDYVEHSYEPYQDLITCNEILKDDGILYLKTLYLDCPDHILKGYSYQLFGKGHYSYFPARTLCSMVYSAGFEIEDLRLGQLIFITARKKRKPDNARFSHYSLENAEDVYDGIMPVRPVT